MSCLRSHSQDAGRPDPSLPWHLSAPRLFSLGAGCQLVLGAQESRLAS